jgi:CheY-like chemotaxis protein
MVKIGHRVETLAGYMAPANLPGEQLHRLVRQALDRVATEEQRDEMLHAALVASGHHDVPPDLGEFAGFLFGPLKRTVTGKLGADAAEVVVDCLEAVVSARCEAASAVGTEFAAPEQGTPTVLVVDSDIAVRSQLIKLLKSKGYNAVSAPDANVALAMCVRYRPDLVLSEVPPDASRGKQLAALLKVAFGDQAPPFIAMMAGEPDGPMETVASTLQKPIDEARLLAAIQPFLGGAVS